jgi:hypothetical protein
MGGWNADGYDDDHDHSHPSPQLHGNRNKKNGRRRGGDVATMVEDGSLSNCHSYEKEEKDPLLLRYYYTNHNIKTQQRQPRRRRWIVPIFASVLFLASLASLFQVVYFHVEFLPFVYSSSTLQQQQQRHKLFLADATSQSSSQPPITESRRTTIIRTSTTTTTNANATMAITKKNHTINGIIRTTTKTKNTTIIEPQPTNRTIPNPTTTTATSNTTNQQPQPPVSSSIQASNNKNNITQKTTTSSEEEDLILQQQILQRLSPDLAKYLQHNPLYQNLRQAMGTRVLRNHTEILEAIPFLWTNLHELYYHHHHDHAKENPIIPHSTHPSPPPPSESTNPIVIGMDTCEQYRAQIPYERRYTGVAGLFNTGTFVGKSTNVLDQDRPILGHHHHHHHHVFFQNTHTLCMPAPTRLSPFFFVQVPMPWNFIYDSIYNCPIVGKFVSKKKKEQHDRSRLEYLC